MTTKVNQIHIFISTFLIIYTVYFPFTLFLIIYIKNFSFVMILMQSIVKYKRIEIKREHETQICLYIVIYVIFIGQIVSCRCKET